MKIAIVHEWLDGFAGGERVLEQLLLLWPDADLFALCDFLPDAERGFLHGRTPRTTFIQRLPFARKRFRWYLGLMPLAIEQLDLSGYDVVVSSHHAVAKGVLTGPDQLHVAYVHSPMRYAWDLQHQYLRECGLQRGPLGAYTRWLLHRLRAWDTGSASRPDIVLANSRYIAGRIAKVWGRDARVLHPPVDVAAFVPSTAPRSHFLVAARLVPYKRVELVVEAFARMPQHRLIVVGDGPQARAVRAAAGAAPNIEFRGHVARDELVALTGAAHAVVYPAEEDFGIATVEAQAAGTPVIAYGRGGARDIVQPDTGILFASQTADAIIAAVEDFAGHPARFPAEACRRNALRFTEQRFRDAMGELVTRAWTARQEGAPCACR